VDINQINQWSEDEARHAFHRCCGSRRWSELLTTLRPFESESALFEAAERVWWGLARADWLEAFSAHPRIGDLDALRTKFTGTSARAAREQAGVDGAPEHSLRELADENRRYEAQFGYIFIVCATGKTAEEMLGLLRARISNNDEAEIRIAAGEQAKITRLRLEEIGP
jgi:2-oxo-4-hydroxy-4-carboxy-5-ureidoimidazoline decarboxylase